MKNINWKLILKVSANVVLALIALATLWGAFYLLAPVFTQASTALLFFGRLVALYYILFSAKWVYKKISQRYKKLLIHKK